MCVCVCAFGKVSLHVKHEESFGHSSIITKRRDETLGRTDPGFFSLSFSHFSFLSLSFFFFQNSEEPRLITEREKRER